MNRLNVLQFAFAAASTFAALSAVCALAVVVAPDAAVTLFNSWFHGLDLRLLVPPGGRPVTLSQAGVGVVSAAVVSFIGGAIFAGCYNLLAGPSER